jgi:hypothetical protein
MSNSSPKRGREEDADEVEEERKSKVRKCNDTEMEVDNDVEIHGEIEGDSVERYYY